MRSRDVFTDPLINNNPVTLQVLGICSALAVTRSLLPALIMGIAVTAVLVFSNSAISLLRGAMPRSIRLILEVTIIATAVIVADEALKAYLPDTSRTLSVFVGLIITNCIVLGRAEAFAMNHPVHESALDGLGNGIGFTALLLIVATVRELLGAGSVFDYPLFKLVEEGGWFTPNAMMALPASAFFIIALVIWAVRSWRSEQCEAPFYKARD